MTKELQTERGKSIPRKQSQHVQRPYDRNKRGQFKEQPRARLAAVQGGVGNEAGEAGGGAPGWRTGEGVRPYDNITGRFLAGRVTRRKKSPASVLYQAASLQRKPAEFMTGLFPEVGVAQSTHHRVANSLWGRNQASSSASCRRSRKASWACLS